MLARKLEVMSWLQVIAFLMVMAAPIHGQPREEPQPYVRGLVKSVDAGAGSIAIMTGEGRGESAAEKTFPLAKDVEIVVNTMHSNLFKEAKLADLVAGLRVTLTVSADKKTVESIVVERPMAQAKVTAVDPAKKTLALGSLAGQADQEKTLSLAGDIDVAIDDGKGGLSSIREGTLSDLVAGAMVRAWLSLDQKEVQSVIVEAPIVTGTLKMLTPTARTVTLLIRPAHDDKPLEELTLAVPEDAVILLDDGRGRRLSVKRAKLEDVPSGSATTVRLSNNRTSVTLLRAQGPLLSGTLKAVDGKNGSITVALPKGRGDKPEEKSFAIAKDTRVQIDGADSLFGNLKVHDNDTVVQLRLSLDQKTVRSIVARQVASQRTSKDPKEKQAQATKSQPQGSAAPRSAASAH